MEERQVQQLDDEKNLLDYWRIVWKRKGLIILITFIAVVISAFYAFSITDIYQSTAVISPINSKESGGGGMSALAQQFGGLPGISLPGSSSASEITNLLKSNILREKIIERYNLLPVLFDDKWDEEKKDWKRGERSSFTLNPSVLMQKVMAVIKPKTQNPESGVQNYGIPAVWDGLRMLNKIVRVADNKKENTITISVEFYDPEMAGKMIEYFLAALTDHMSGEAKRVASTNRKYLEEQLWTTTDPLIKQKIYNLIAQQIETSMMSEVKENFAFKVIDPPKAPDRKINPNRLQIVMMSLVAALSAAVFLAFFLEYIEKIRSQGGRSV